MGSTEGETEIKEEETKGTLLFTGVTDWDIINKFTTKPSEELPNFPSPTRFKSFPSKVSRVISGSAAHHCLAIAEGKLYAWGANSKGQLGLNHTKTTYKPCVVEGLLKGKTIVDGAAGKGHTVVFDATGTSYSFGSNKYGQLGLGKVKQVITKKSATEEIHITPVKNLVPNAKQITCGAEFTLWLTSTGGVMSAGCPEYGQLGHGTDNQYNSSASSLKMFFQPQPTPRLISALSNKKMLQIASGNNHSLALDGDGHLYSWGFGGYGRLGHNIQRDEFAPRRIEFFENRLALPLDCKIACGGMFSFATIKGGQLYVWGKTKIQGDTMMYPKPLLDLSGWAIRSITCGTSTIGIASENSTITWGQASYGELGYGAGGRKTSANPDKVNALEGMVVHQVACGAGHMLFVLDGKVDASKFPEWDAPDAVDKPPEVAAGTKRKGGAGRGRGRGRGRGKRGR